MKFDQALDAQLETHKFYSTEYGKKILAGCIDSQMNPHNHDPLLREIMVAPDIRNWMDTLPVIFLEALWRGDTMFVAREIEDLIMIASEDVPNDLSLTEHDILSPFGFCMFESHLVGIDINGEQTEIVGFVWAIDRPNRMMHTYMMSSAIEGSTDAVNIELLKRMGRNKVPPTVMSHYYPIFMDAGTPIFVRDDAPLNLDDGYDPDDENVQASVKFVRHYVAIIASTFLLAQQQISDVQRKIPSRAARKRAERYEWENRSYISYITLRHKKRPAGDEPKKVDWSHRWVVQGFWRNQYYPSTKTHAWKYIHEYIKGPEDKPIVRRERRVFNFKR